MFVPSASRRRGPRRSRPARGDTADVQGETGDADELRLEQRTAQDGEGVGRERLGRAAEARAKPLDLADVLPAR
jgi:hypothetical protein